jgi:predicted phosphodiesterase
MDEASSIDEIPCSDSKDPFSFFFLADSQQGTDEVAKFAKLMRTIPGAAVLHGGDIVHKGTDFEMWTSYFDSMSTIEKSKILFPAVGNHEYLRDQAVPLWKRFFRYEARDAHYSFDLGAAHVIALNSNFDYDPNQKGDQIAWLKSELAVPAKWKIVYFHHPGYSEGIANSPVAPRKEHVFVQSTLIPLFEENHVDLVLNGHVHLFETSVKNGIRYLTVGPAGGKMGLKGGKNPYLLKGAKKRTIAEISVSPAKIEAKSLGIDGELVDEFEIKK